MKTIVRLLGLAAFVGLLIIIIRAVRQYQQDNEFQLTANMPGEKPTATQKRSLSPELLEILADPADKGPVELLTDGEGKEWLVNRRNGYRYPVEDGIPIMLIEEGEKYRDASLVAA